MSPEVPQTLPYQAALNQAAATLAAAGLEAPRREARLLLAHLLNLSPRALPPANAQINEAALAALTARRAAHEPLAYITGTQAFWTIDLEVSPATLIPRPDSETLIEAALALFATTSPPIRILDLGTGTGCLLLAALTEFPNAFGIGVDLIPQAAALAARNAARLNLSHRAAFLTANWAAPLRGRFDLILSNPPYITSATIPSLMPEVANHEPITALDGGQNGLTAYATLIPTLPALLAPGGTAILELGQGQAKAAAALAKAAGFTHIATRQDLGGIERALILQAPA